VTMPFYASPEQLMRERSELARKGIARGRSVVVLRYGDGVLFVAENPSTTLHKISEIYDRIGFAAVGKYNEFENLRRAGIRHTDTTGYQNDRRDVSARALANLYAQVLGTIFTEQLKPFEVELCVAEVGESTASDRLYRLTYDGSVFDEPNFVVMGGQTDTINTKLKDSYQDDMELRQAVQVAVRALSSAGNGGNTTTRLNVKQLEVAVLERSRPRRTFRRIEGTALESMLPAPAPDETPANDAGEGTGKSKPTAKDAAKPSKDTGKPSGGKANGNGSGTK
jgi:proteasome alpha subunit